MLEATPHFGRRFGPSTEMNIRGISSVVQVVKGFRLLINIDETAIVKLYLGSQIAEPFVSDLAHAAAVDVLVVATCIHLGIVKRSGRSPPWRTMGQKVAL
jgi:hypothetical protein